MRLLGNGDARRLFVIATVAEERGAVGRVEAVESALAHDVSRPRRNGGVADALPVFIGCRRERGRYCCPMHNGPRLGRHQRVNPS